MGKKSKEARRARRDAEHANEEAAGDHRSVAAGAESGQEFDAVERTIIRALQICMPTMAA